MALVAQMDTFLTYCEQTLTPARVLTDKLALDLLSQDFSGQIAPTAYACLRPETLEDVVLIVAAAAKHGVPLFIRGGATSYTLAHTPTSDAAVLIDMRGLSRILDLNIEDRTILVEAGATWGQIEAALAGTGLCLRIHGPVSGGAATIGGSLGNNVCGAITDDISHDLIGIEVVTKAGAIVRTGGLQTDSRHLKIRFSAPDLTGAFINDAGRFGVRTKAAFRLRRVRPIKRKCALTFANFDLGLSAFIALAGTECASRLMLLESGLAANLGAATGSASCLIATCDGFDQVSVDAAIEHLAAIGRDMLGVRARALENILPDLDTFLPLSVLLQTPTGASTLPVNAVVPYSRAQAVSQAMAAVIASHATELSKLDAGADRAAFAVEGQVGLETIFHWRDRLTDIRLAICPADERARWKIIPENAAARDLILTLRDAMVRDIFAPAGASHLQNGRYYTDIASCRVLSDLASITDLTALAR